MYKRLLVATDGSELSGKAVAHAIALARATGATLVALYATPEFAMRVYSDATASDVVPRERYDAAAAAEAEAILAGIRSEAAAANVECAVAHKSASTPWRAILDAAHEHGVDAIVMASHGRSGISAMLLGSETLKVLTHSTIPVVVVR